MKRTASMKIRPTEESRELELYAVNSGALYRQSIVPTVRNLARKHSKGTFDADRAIDAFYPIATAAARMYCREFARVEDSPHVFSVSDRFTAAAGMVEYFAENILRGDL